MRKFIAMAAVAAFMASLTACGNDKVLEGNTYPVFGLFNMDDTKSDKVCYEISMGSVIMGIIFSETIIVPVVVVGWDLMQPTGLKGANGKCGIDAH